MRELTEKHPVYQVVLSFLLALLVFGVMHEVSAHAARQVPPASPATEQAVAKVHTQDDPHLAMAGNDDGPGEAEPALARHPLR
jgi:hypothetical protein